MPASKSRPLCLWVIVLLIGLLSTSARGQSTEAPGGDSKQQPTQAKPQVEAKAKLAMSPAVAVVRVDGLERYSPLPDATLTSSDKLKVYFRPLHYKVETDPKNKSPYRAKFIEDGRIRRKGEKTILAKEDKLLEYETRFDTEDYQIYLVNTIGLESLTPGEYEFDITLHDLIDGQASASQTLAFRVVPSQGEPSEKAKPEPEPQTTKPAKAKKTKAGRSPKRVGSLEESVRFLKGQAWSPALASPVLSNLSPSARPDSRRTG